MYQTFVAVGDSFTEGLDDRRTDGSYRGWADLVAGELAEQVPRFRYANLAVRGRRLRSIRDEQVPLAEAMAPSLLTVSAGGNDIIGFRCDATALAQSMHEVLERLVGAAGTVVVFTGFDPRGRLPMSRLLATRAATFNASVRSSADLLGARVVDLWTMPRLCEPRMWASDRLHLSTEGHGLVADAVLDLLGVTSRTSGSVLQEPVTRSWLAARRSDAIWTSTYLAPWVGRKLRGRSTGDFLNAKLPELTSIPAPRRELGTDGTAGGVRVVSARSSASTRSPGSARRPPA
jgi:lysophospholipase L1-like esterase